MWTCACVYVFQPLFAVSFISISAAYYCTIPLILTVMSNDEAYRAYGPWLPVQTHLIALCAIEQTLSGNLDTNSKTKDSSANNTKTITSDCIFIVMCFYWHSKPKPDSHLTEIAQ